MQLGAEAVFVGSGIFKSEDPSARACAIVKAANNFNNPEKLLEASRDLGNAMPGLTIRRCRNRTCLADARLVSEKGWRAGLQGDFAAHAAALIGPGRSGVSPRERAVGRSRWTRSCPAARAPPCSSCCTTTGCSAAGRVRPAQAHLRHLRGRDSAGPDVSGPAQESLGLMDIGVERNAYGRQIDSRVAEAVLAIPISPARFREEIILDVLHVRQDGGSVECGAVTARAKRCWRRCSGGSGSAMAQILLEEDAAQKATDGLTAASSLFGPCQASRMAKREGNEAGKDPTHCRPKKRQTHLEKEVAPGKIDVCSRSPTTPADGSA